MVANPDTEPTLAEMVRAAIRVLSKEDNGFFLFVEGGKIDLAHHKTRARRALDETIEFSKAVRVAQELTSVQVRSPGGTARARRALRGALGVARWRVGPDGLLLAGDADRGHGRPRAHHVHLGLPDARQ